MRATRMLTVMVETTVFPPARGGRRKLLRHGGRSGRDRAVADLLEGLPSAECAGFGVLQRVVERRVAKPEHSGLPVRCPRLESR